MISPDHRAQAAEEHSWSEESGQGWPQQAEVFSADIDYLNKSLDSIKKHYKTLDNFIINILEVNINKLKEMYLEK